MSKNHTNTPKDNANTSTEEKKNEFVNVASVWASRDYPGMFSLSADDYYGELYFRRKILDANKNEVGEEFYRLKYADLVFPKDFGKGIPEGLEYRVRVNLANPKAAELQVVPQAEEPPTPSYEAEAQDEADEQYSEDVEA